MPYALVQTGVETPRIDQLKAAFRGIPGLTPMDAPILCKDAYGILVKGFELERANLLQIALAAQGVETEVVDEKNLPPLPQMRHVIRAECTPEALLIYDPMGKAFPLEWKNILMIAAGKVSVVEFKRTATAELPPQSSSLGVIDNFLFKGSSAGGLGRPKYSAPSVNYHTSESRNERWILEIVIAGAGLRYNLEGERAAQPLFQYLGARRTDDLSGNFKLLVQDLCQFAPGAAINRGAYYLRGNAPTLVYPSKNAFYEEITWLLWKLFPRGPDAP